MRGKVQVRQDDSLVRAKGQALSRTVLLRHAHAGQDAARGRGARGLAI